MIAYCNYIPRQIHTLSRYVPTAAIYLLLYSYSTLNVVLTVYTYLPLLHVYLKLDWTGLVPHFGYVEGAI